MASRQPEVPGKLKFFMVKSIFPSENLFSLNPVVLVPCDYLLFICTPSVPDACGGQKRAPSLLELELQSVVSCREAAGN